jgi:hypothetical protein
MTPNASPHWSWRDIEVAAEIYQINVSDLYDDDELRGRGGVQLRTFQLIAQKLNCAVARVRSRFETYGPSFTRVRGPGLWVSAQALADRDARKAAAELRTQTAEFFGDPPPGYSALDRRDR